MVGNSSRLWSVSGKGAGHHGDRPVEGPGAVEKLEVEGSGCLTVNFAAGGGLKGHACDEG